MNNGLELRTRKVVDFPIAGGATGLLTEGSQNPEQAVPSFCNSAYNTDGQYFRADSRQVLFHNKPETLEDKRAEGNRSELKGGFS